MKHSDMKILQRNRFTVHQKLGHPDRQRVGTQGLSGVGRTMVSTDFAGTGSFVARGWSRLGEATAKLLRKKGHEVTVLVQERGEVGRLALEKPTIFHQVDVTGQRSATRARKAQAALRKSLEACRNRCSR